MRDRKGRYSFFGSQQHSGWWCVERGIVIDGSAVVFMAGFQRQQAGTRCIIRIEFRAGKLCDQHKASQNKQGSCDKKPDLLCQ